MTARVLVVDDEPDLEPLILQKFRRQIREGELEFVFARHGEDALEKLEADPSIDVVLTDINMPVMDGLTLLTRIADLDRLLKTVIVSAYDDLQNIRTAMNRGAFDFLTKPIDFHDFESTLRKTLSEVANLREGLMHREQLQALQSELSFASRIQQSILPREFPADPRFEIFAEMQPARMVSGDFFDIFELGQDRVGFAVGDVSGKGIAAAIYMAVCRTLLRATVHRDPSPEAALIHMNDVLLRQGDSELYVTLFYGVLDLSTGRVDYCIAGQPSPYLISADRGIAPASPLRGNMLGLIEDPELGKGEMQLSPGDMLVSATDGVADAEGPADTHFSNQGFLKVLCASTRLTAREVVSDTFRAVQEFAEGEQQSDDITVLCLRWLG
jgi:sigma-B regulation protein RsbU (phosphoserine phosphatase)